MTSVTFDGAVDFAIDHEKRTISGILLPFGETSRPAKDRVTGRTARYRFSAAAVTLPDPSDVVLNYGHDRDSLTAQIGIATSLTKTPTGVLAVFKIARTPEGDAVLALGEDRILKYFSAETAGRFKAAADGVHDAIQSTIDGAAVVRIPAFTGAHITHVAAAAADTHQEEPMNECSTCDKVHADGVTACESTPAFAAAAGAELVKKVDALDAKIDDLAKLKRPAEPGAPGGPQFEVYEEPIYRFDGTEASSGHDFSTDLIAGLRGDGVAMARVTDFMAARTGPASPVFAPVDTDDVAAVNPKVYRADMFQDEKPEMPTPLYNAFHAGAIDSMTPFYYSKLGEVSGLVADHVEGEDPAEGTFTTVLGPTVTPKAKSGRINLNREVIDQGGNPQVSGLILAKFDRAWRQMLEAESAAVLKSGVADYAQLAVIANGAEGKVIGKAIKKALTGLKFTADGQRFTTFFGAQKMYTELSDAEDDMGRPLYPILSASNADGFVAQGLGSINVGGQRIDPTWSLGPQDISYYVDPGAVRVWNSGITRLDRVLETAAGWNIDIFGYVATHLYDATGVKKLSYSGA